MADNDCWGAFGSDSDSDSSSSSSKDRHLAEQSSDPFEPAADATSLAVTQHFASLAKSSGVSLKERVIGIGNCHDRDGTEELRETTMMKQVGGRGMKVVRMQGGDQSDQSASGTFRCDAAILVTNDDDAGGGGNPNPSHSRIRRALLPGGLLWLMISLGFEGEERVADAGHDGSVEKGLEDYSEAVWEVDSASAVYSSSRYRVVSVRKRSCVINAWSCPWMDKQEKVQLRGNDEFRISAKPVLVTGFKRRLFTRRPYSNSPSLCSLIF